MTKAKKCPKCGKRTLKYVGGMAGVVLRECSSCGHAVRELASSRR